MVSIFDRDPPITGSLALGETVSGDLPQGGTQVWTFAADAGTQVSITLDSAWASHLTLGPPDRFDRAAEAYNDLGGGLAIICNRTLDISGTWRLYVAASPSRPDQTLGRYTLTLQSGTPPTPAAEGQDASLIAVRSPCLPRN